MSGRSQAELRALLDRVTRLRILVVGDVMLDEYRIGEVERISPEAPVPIVRVREERHALGGAGNVARNLVALGAAVELVGCIGCDREGGLVEAQTGVLGLASGGLVAIPGRPTTHKLRVVARGRQMLRLDREEETPLPAEARARLEVAVFARLPDCDAVVLADYDKGVFADGLGHAIIAAARARGIFVGADPKRELHRFRGASLVKPNLAEACAAVGFRADDLEGRRRLAEKLRSELSGAEIVVTRGGDGATVLGSDGRVLDVATRPLAVFDVQGAGDTAMAALVASRVAGASLPLACRIANAAAAVAVSKLGTAAVSRAELEGQLAESIGDAGEMGEA